MLEHDKFNADCSVKVLPGKTRIVGIEGATERKKSIITFRGSPVIILDVFAVFLILIKVRSKFKKEFMFYFIHLSRSIFQYFNYFVSVTAGGPVSPQGHMLSEFYGRLMLIRSV